MSRRDYCLVIALAIISGIAGGAIANRLGIGSTAFTQQVDLPARVIKAHAFQLVDAAGNVRSNLAFTSAGRSAEWAVVGNKEGNQISVKYSAPFPQGVGLELLDTEGNIIWSAPPESKAMFVR